jgi:hypothetical protein
MTRLKPAVLILVIFCSLSACSIPGIARRHCIGHQKAVGALSQPLVTVAPAAYPRLPPIRRPPSSCRLVTPQHPRLCQRRHDAHPNPTPYPLPDGNNIPEPEGTIQILLLGSTNALAVAASTVSIMLATLNRRG